SSQQLLERLAADAPVVYEHAFHGAWSPPARKNLLRFLSAAFTSSERYGAVVRHRQAIERALSIFENSDYLTDMPVLQPEEIATLANWDEATPRNAGGYLFEGLIGVGRNPVDPVFAYLATSLATHGEKVALLRQHFRHRVFASGARDIIEHRSVY